MEKKIQPTLDGLRMTGNKFKIHNIELFTMCSERICEISGHHSCGQSVSKQKGVNKKKFGCQWQWGVNENPNAQEFMKNTQTLHVVNNMCPSVIWGNSGKSDVTPPLHKHSRPQPKKLHSPF